MSFRPLLLHRETCPACSSSTFGGGVHSQFVSIGPEFTKGPPAFHTWPEYDWYRTILALRGKEAFFTYPIFHDLDAPIVFSTGKLLRDPVDFRAIGFLVVNFRSEVIRGLFPNPLDRPIDERYFVAGASPEATRFFSGDSRSPDFIVRDTRSVSDTAMSSFSQAEVLATTINSATGLHVIKAVPRQNLFTLDALLIGILSLIVICIGTVDLAYSVFFARAVASPLARVGDAINRAAEGDRRIDMSFRPDEIGAIGNRFVELVNTKLRIEERATQLRMQRQVAELNAMQARLRPHFLYNTLDSIYWLAKSGRSEECASVTEALSHLLRNSIISSAVEWTLAEEVDMIQRYFWIQDVRFRGRISLSLEVSPELLSISVPRLVLQPIVENAVHHGLEPKPGTGSVRVLASRHENDVVFLVIDDGVGFDRSNDSVDGLGLATVEEQLQLLFGSRALVRVTSLVGVGTTVRIEIPHRARELR